MNLSIIIPSYNTEEYIEKCINSLFRPSGVKIDYEVIVVDDCSTDSTADLVEKMQRSNPNIKLYKTKCNSGPGIARNIGVGYAKGEWILFLDSDDCYVPDAFMYFDQYIQKHDYTETDIIMFNWAYEKQSTQIPHTSNEGLFENSPDGYNKQELIKAYLQFKIDHSVIYSLFRKKMILENSIQFEAGYHEDVAYMFKIYWNSRAVVVYNDVLYLKKSRVDSIVNSVTERHLIGFLQAYKDIFIFLKKEGCHVTYSKEYNIGLIALLATRIREIYRNSRDVKERVNLFKSLFFLWEKFGYEVDFDKKNFLLETLYLKICKRFIETMEDRNISYCEKEKIITKFLTEVANKRWGCYDLHHSIFLRPNEIRTCCKRFFDKGEMKGDVCLGKASDEKMNVNAELILKRKKILSNHINRGDATPCSQCPFLEFRNWDNFKIKKLSFEHHSLCNLRCSYCSEDYYGGTVVQYNIDNLIQSFIEKDMLSKQSLVIWAGGEPLLGNKFGSMIKKINNYYPDMQHRILTNSTISSDELEELLKKGVVSIFTSIDAGCQETYQKIHGKDEFFNALKNIQKYSSINSAKVTLKYIFTGDNFSFNELIKFANVIEKNGLTKCNFQISCNFKQEHIQSDIIIAMIFLFYKLREKGCSRIYFDELIWQRLNWNEGLLADVLKQITTIGIDKVVANSNKYSEIAIWGIGEMAKLFLEKSIFFKKVKIKYFINNSASEINEFYKYEVKRPEELLKSEIPILIAAVQNYSLVYSNICEMGVKEDRIIKEVIV